MNRANSVSKKKMFLILTMACMVALLSGCCSTFCKDYDPYKDKDFVYVYDTPKSQDDCPQNTTFKNSVEDTDLQPHDGGAGVIDRDGRGGVVDRDGVPVKTFCLKDCSAAQDNSEIPWMLIEDSNEAGYLVADLPCY